MKKFLMYFSLIVFLINISLINIYAIDENNDEINEFLSTCNLYEYDNLTYSNPIPTYEENKLITEKVNYFIFSSNNIIGVLTDLGNSYIYMNLSNKEISKYNIKDIYSIEYENNDILIYFDNLSFSVANNDFFNKKSSRNEKIHLIYNKINLIQSRASSKYLSVPAYQQDTNYTCWATCIASVAKFKGKLYIVPSVISKNHGIDPNRKGATLDETRMAMNSQFAISSSSIYQGPSAMEIISLINSSKPIITGFNSSDSGHMVVIRGYSEGSNYVTVSYMDPATATYKSSQIITDRKIQFSVGYKVYTSSCYLKLN